MQAITHWVFYKDVDSTSVRDNPFSNIKGEIMTVEISGDAATQSFVFEGKTDLNNPEWTEISGVNLTDYSFTTTPDQNGIWQVPIDGLQIFRVRLVSISGGSATVLGRVECMGV